MLMRYSLLSLFLGLFFAFQSVEAATDTIPPTAPTNLTYTKIKREPSGEVYRCNTIQIYWTPSTDSGGSGLSHYKIYRNGVFVDTRSVPTFGDTGYLVGDTEYQFDIAAVDKASNESAKSSISIRTPSCRDNAAVGTLNVQVFMLHFPDRQDKPINSAQLQQLFFNGSSSANTFFQENSYGQLGLSGNVHPQWLVMPQNITHYCPNVIYQPAVGANLYYGCSTQLREDAYALASNHFAAATGQSLNTVADRIAYIYGGVGTVGLAGGTEISISGHWTSDMLSTVVHELGHTFNAKHDGSWTCAAPSGFGPSLTNITQGGCQISEYGGYDPQAGGAGVLRQFNAYHKDLFGWLDADQMSVAAIDGEYLIENLETPSSEPIGSRSPKYLRIPIPDSEDFYFVEYRTLRGSDASNSAIRPSMDAVRVGLKLSGFRGADTDTLSLENAGGVRRHGEIIPGRAFVDNFRKIRIEMLERLEGSAKAKVKISFGDGAVTPPSTPVVELSLSAPQVKRKTLLQFKATVNSNKQVARVVLLKGTASANSDRTAPYNLKWKIPAAAKIGTSYPFKAKVFFKDKSTVLSNEIVVSVAAD